MRSSTQKLIDALLEIKPCLPRDDLIKAAREGAYHDFDSNSATPITDLVRDLELAASCFPPWSPRRQAFLAIVDCAEAGLFDAGTEEAEEWVHSDEGRAAIATLMSKR